ncbi:MAG: hypothetical protein HRT54_17300 [Colwellia sp.]|nr:hypothetical protein [Colwellia sp.]
MSKDVLIILHGIGEHTADSFEKEVVDAANNAIQRYDSYKQLKFEDVIDVRSIAYDHIFEEERKKMAENGSTVSKYISDNLGNVDLPNIIPTLAQFDKSFGDDDFKNTHVLDVLLYLSILGERVRSYVLNEIMDIVTHDYKDNNVNYHILSHSLGTSVMHDSLAKLYTVDKNPPKGKLNVRSPHFKSYWTFANVSRLVTHFSGLTGPFESIVKPGHTGVTQTFYNIYNEFDPIAFDIFKRFDPQKGEGWIPDEVFEDQYNKVVTKAVSRKNTHSIMGYIEDPLVSYPFLYTLMGEFDPSEDEQKTANAKFKSIESELEKITHFKAEHHITKDLKGFVKLLQKFDIYIKEDLA